MNWHELFRSGLEAFLKLDPENHYALQRCDVWLYIGSQESRVFKKYKADQWMYVVKDDRYFKPAPEWSFEYSGVKVVIVQLQSHFRFSR
jgi:hypothetical protein